MIENALLGFIVGFSVSSYLHEYKNVSILKTLVLKTNNVINFFKTRKDDKQQTEGTFELVGQFYRPKKDDKQQTEGTTGSEEKYVAKFYTPKNGTRYASMRDIKNRNPNYEDNSKVKPDMYSKEFEQQ